MLDVGDVLPAFSLSSGGGDVVSSAALAGKRYVLYFYPKDNTPGCTTEACSFRDHLPDFERLAVPVFGVSADPVSAHQRFAKKFDLNFPLLADPEHQLLEPLGVWAEKSLYGRRYFGIQRATFIVGPDGRVEHVWPKVKVKGHTEDVLAVLAGLTKSRG